MMAGDRDSVEEVVLRDLQTVEEVADSGQWAAQHSFDHQIVCDTVKSLNNDEFVDAKEIRRKLLVLTEEGEGVVELGSPEVRLFLAVPADGGIPLKELEAKMPDVFKLGRDHAMKKKWLGLDRATGLCTRKTKAEDVTDDAKDYLKAVQDGQDVPEQETKMLLKRKLIVIRNWTGYKWKKGPKYATERRKPATDLTRELLQNGAWKELKFKEYNYDVLGRATSGGHLHPLLKVRAQFRKIFLEMGFEEMPTNNFVESSFWNFDALFQPQQHPARDSHDTFFLEAPAGTVKLPEDYLQRVKTMHEVGGNGSTGYGYDWKRAEAEKNLLRTHTTAVSSRMLYKLAQEGFVPKKYFSIDRVFRNEAVDRTHLAEFHQVEGVVCDRGLTLGNLIGVLNDFYGRLGVNKLRFKPAYNPYTEPSMEVFSYHEKLQRWVEIGNSGMFRPEMLLPMGLPPDVNVIAWGLSLERPTMILYNIDNIRDLFGHKVDLEKVQNNEICRIGL